MPAHWLVHNNVVVVEVEVLVLVVVDVLVVVVVLVLVLVLVVVRMNGAHSGEGNGHLPHVRGHCSNTLSRCSSKVVLVVGSVSAAI